MNSSSTTPIIINTPNKSEEEVINHQDLSFQLKNNFNIILQENLNISKRLDKLQSIINTPGDLTDPDILMNYEKAIQELKSIDPKYKLSSKAREEKSIIENNNELMMYYDTFQKVFNECINMSPLIEKGYLSKSISNNTFFTILSKTGNNLPFGSIIFSLLENSIDTYVNSKRHVRYQNLNRLNYNGNIGDVALFVERLSRYFTIQYKNIILDNGNLIVNVLSDDKKKSFMSKFKDGVKNIVSKFDKDFSKGLFMDEKSSSYQSMLSMVHVKEVIDNIMCQDEDEILRYVEMLRVEKKKGNGMGDELIEMLFEEVEKKLKLLDNVSISLIQSTSLSVNSISETSNGSDIVVGEVKVNVKVEEEVIMNDASKEELEEIKKKNQEQTDLINSLVNQVNELKLIAENNKKMVEKNERVLKAAFQMESKEEGNQIVDAVSTRDGVKLIVHNPRLDERFNVLENELYNIKEDVEIIRDDVNMNKEDIEDIKNKTKKKK